MNNRSGPLPENDVLDVTSTTFPRYLRTSSRIERKRTYTMYVLYFECLFWVSITLLFSCAQFKCAYQSVSETCCKLALQYNNGLGHSRFNF